MLMCGLFRMNFPVAYPRLPNSVDNVLLYSRGCEPNIDEEEEDEEDEDDENEDEDDDDEDEEDDDDEVKQQRKRS